MDAKSFFGDWIEVIDVPVLESTLSFMEEQIKQGHLVYPEPSILFNPFLLCPYKDLKLVILNCYPLSPLTNGLAFGVKADVPYEKFPENLKSLYDCIDKYVQWDLPFATKDLTFPTMECWAKQGVLMLNYPLCESNLPEDIWYLFTKKLLKSIANSKKDVIFAVFDDVGNRFVPDINPDNLVVSNTHVIKEDIFGEIDKKLQEHNKSVMFWY